MYRPNFSQAFQRAGPTTVPPTLSAGLYPTQSFTSGLLSNGTQSNIAYRCYYEFACLLAAPSFCFCSSFTLRSSSSYVNSGFQLVDCPMVDRCVFWLVIYKHVCFDWDSLIQTLLENTVLFLSIELDADSIIFFAIWRECIDVCLETRLKLVALKKKKEEMIEIIYKRNSLFQDRRIWAWRTRNRFWVISWTQRKWQPLGNWSPDIENQRHFFWGPPTSLNNCCFSNHRVTFT